MRKLYFFIVVFFFLGCFYFLIHQKVIIVLCNRPGIKNNKVLNSHLKDKRTIIKNITLYFEADGVLKPDKRSIVWGANISVNVSNLVNHWLSLIYQEQIINKKVALKSVAISQSGLDIYLSFDFSFLSSNWSIFKKWLVVESLIKTIRELDLQFNTVFFLVNNLILEDDHLDFSCGWTTIGFMKEEIGYE